MSAKRDVFASTEIVGALLTRNMNSAEALSFEDDAISYVSSSLNVDVRNVSLSVVRNEGDSVNLILPYYSAIDNFSAQVMDEVDMDSVAGGEIIISLAIFGGVIGGTAIAAVASVGVAAATAITVTAGVAAGAVAAGAVAGAVVGGVAGYKGAKGENLDGSSK